MIKSRKPVDKVTVEEIWIIFGWKPVQIKNIAEIVELSVDLKLLFID